MFWNMWFGWGSWMMYWMLGYWIVSIIAILWALIDISHTKKDTGYKLIWALICILLGIIGVIIYYFVEKSNKHRG
jgi:hypothetical protein